MSDPVSHHKKDPPTARKVVLPLLALVAFMTAGSFAAVPFYNWFCKVTGYGGTTTTAASSSDLVLDQTITVRFDASLGAGMEWEFKALQHVTELKIGETGLAFYEAYNPTDRVIAGTASYNVTPFSAGNYFSKIACFCFVEQVLQPGERVRMPVTFYVDPGIVDDIEAKRVTSITLSYTFYETDLPVDQAALEEEKDNTQVN
ncbi:MAG: cytochrome c oxidase assembly protein [Rhodobacteraceae bacterium]|nr:cytochrome c oxidase assembly protein [Paracoccaceae bacterium]